MRAFMSPIGAAGSVGCHDYHDNPRWIGQDYAAQDEARRILGETERGTQVTCGEAIAIVFGPLEQRITKRQTVNVGEVLAESLAAFVAEEIQ